MARARNIKPALFKNEVLGVADPMLTLLFEGLRLLADKAGRLEDRPLRIKGELFPYRDGLDVDGMLAWLAAEGF
ncbi:phage replication protein, partial [Pseudomonas syringae]|nr:phage replication protein [Pseudomonas syringae]